MKKVPRVYTVEEKKEQGYKEIHQFYARQHANVQKLQDFDGYSQLVSLDLGELNVFCRDFKIQLPRSKI